MSIFIISIFLQKQSAMLYFLTGNLRIVLTWGVYPCQVNSIQIQAPDSIQGCRDFSAALKVIPSEGVPGRHILHAELIPPQGEARFFLKRNLTADRGQAEFKLRIAENDPDGVWTFRVTDSMTGVSAEKKIRKKTE